MFPGQSGKIVATFMSRRTRPAAANGSSMRNARIAAQTAASWKNQPTHWQKHGHRGRRAAPQHAEPVPRHHHVLADAAELASDADRVPPRRHEARLRAVPPRVRRTITRLVTAQPGIRACIIT